MLAQRDSDANRNVQESRANALASLSSIDMQTGSNLIQQFETQYISRVFNVTFPFCVGGPDFKHMERHRRATGNWESAFFDLNRFTEMCARRVEAQFRWDSDLNPGLWSLAFASKVNLGLSMAYTKSLKRLQYLAEDDHELGVGEAAARIYHLLWHGEYWDEAKQKRVPMQGNVSKLLDIIGLGDKERALIRNSQFMSGKIAGTRQIRRSIFHMVFSSRIVYGNPVFMTVTPSERHSGLLLRLSRHRRSDPALKSLPEELGSYICMCIWFYVYFHVYLCVYTYAYICRCIFIFLCLCICR